jgi:hypothetical protein
MAPAVPVALLEWPGHDLEVGARVPRRLYVLHSESDWVLSWAFPQGQRFAREMGFDSGPQQLSGGNYDRAVGTSGEPSRVFRGRFPMVHPWRWSFIDRGYGHGDYWPGNESVAQVARFFNVPGPRGLSAGAVPGARGLPVGTSVVQLGPTARPSLTPRRIGV